MLQKSIFDLVRIVLKRYLFFGTWDLVYTLTWFRMRHISFSVDARCEYLQQYSRNFQELGCDFHVFLIQQKTLHSFQHTILYLIHFDIIMSFFSHITEYLLNFISSFRKLLYVFSYFSEETASKIYSQADKENRKTQKT